jgi:hypothetical protein
MILPPDQLVADLRRFIAPSYPDMDIRVMSWDRDPGRLAIHFTDPRFALLYPYQRWHYLTHLIPADYYEAHLENTVWFELAPGENPDDLCYPDEDLIDEITPNVMGCLTGRGFFSRSMTCCAHSRRSPNEPVAAATFRSRGPCC